MRESLRRALELEGYEVELAGDGEAALERLDAGRRRAGRGDPRRPHARASTGSRCVDGCAASGNAVPVLMLTARAEVDSRVAGLDAGADDYLAEAVRARRAARAPARAAAPAGHGDERTTCCGSPTSSSISGRARCAAATAAIELTRTEFALLELFLRNPRQVLTRSIIFERVWGYDFGPTSNSLDVYIGYLRRKTEDGGTPRLIHTVRGVGYALREA